MGFGWLNTGHRKKLVFMIVAVLLVSIFECVRLGIIMTAKSEYYMQKADELHQRERKIKAKRGRILDRNGIVLAANEVVCTVSVIHSQIEDEEKVIKVLAGQLDIDVEEVTKKVKKVSSMEYIKTNVEKEIGDEIRKYNLAGVKVDINLPYENGYEVCRKIKQVMPVPIIFVTSRDTNADELKSIQVGGIDFITKPYDTLILLEKIKRALQLSNPSNFRELVKKDCTLDLHLSILKYQEQSIELTRNEFRILYYFFMNEDKVISKEELLEKLWNDKYYIDENVLLVNMTRLKKKMKEIGIVHLLENIRGKGWKL